MARRKSPPCTVYLGAPHVEDDLVLQAKHFGAQNVSTVAPGIAVARRAAKRPPTFARQVLPMARVLDGEGVDALLAALYDMLDDDEAEHWLSLATPPHVFGPDVLRAPRGQKPKDPLANMLETFTLRQEQKRQGRAAKYGLDERRVDGLGQLLLIGHNRAFVSLSAAPLAMDALTAWPVPFAAGRARVPTDKSAPSTAYKKFVEALAWLDVTLTADDVVVDLGGAPGGWSHIALRAGATVIGVDRGDFHEDLRANPRFTHLKKDAFIHAPLDEATILACDIIGDPARVFALAEAALDRPKVRAGVVTLKLTRPADLDFLDDVRRKMSARYDVVSRLQHLAHNKQEVTLLWRRSSRSA